MRLRMPTFRPIPFQRKLMMFATGITIVPVLLAGLISSQMAARSVQEQVNVNHELLLGQIEYRLNDLMENLNIYSIAIATNDRVERSVELGPPGHADVGQFMALIDSLRKQINYSLTRYEVSLIYKKFDYVYSSDKASARYTDSVYSQILQNGRTDRNFPFIVAPSVKNNRELMLFRPVPLQSFYSNGIAVLRVRLDDWVRIMDESVIGSDYRSKLVVADEQGTIILSNRSGDIGSKLAASGEPFRFRNPSGEAVGTFRYDGEEYRLSSRPFSGQGWTLVAMTPRSALYEQADRIRQTTWWIVGALIAFWAVVAFGGSKLLYAPIERMLRRLLSEYALHAEPRDGLRGLEKLMNEMIRDNRKLQTHIRELEPQLREHMYRRLLWGELTEADIRSMKGLAEPPSADVNFRVLLVAVDEVVRLFERDGPGDPAFIHHVLRNMTEEICRRRYSCLTLTMQPGQIVAIVSETAGDESSVREGLVGTAADIREAVRTCCEFTVSVSISRAFPDGEGIRKAYRDAQELFGYRLIAGPDATFTEHSIEVFAPAMRQSIRDIVQLQQNILSELAGGHLEEANRQLRHLTEQVGRYARNPATMLSVYSYLLVGLDSFLHELGCDMPEIVGDAYKELHRLGTLPTVCEWFAGTVFPAIAELLGEEQVPKQERAVQHILHNLHREFDADLQDISRRYDISVPHLSRLFKEKTGETFSDYLIRVRMDQAKQWLSRTPLPIKTIATRLGYSTVQSFNRTFKQIAGMPPGEYRDRSGTSGSAAVVHAMPEME